MEQKHIEYQYNYLPVEVFYFLVYSASKEHNLFIETAERNYKMVLRSFNKKFNKGKIEILFLDSKLDVIPVGYNADELEVLNAEIIAPILQLLESSKEVISVEEAESGIKKMIQELFPQSDLYVGIEPTKRPGFFQLFIPRRNYITTPVIILLNVLVFLAMVLSGISFFSPDPVAVLNWGGNSRLHTMDGEWWRLITCNYVHFGIIHIAFNMYAFIYIGRTLEPMIGSMRLAIAYTLAGVSSSLVSLSWHVFGVGAGASGAIFGVYGLFLALVVFNFLGKDVRKQMVNGLLTFIGLNVIISLSMGFDNAGHMGGVISGFVIGAFYLPGLRNNKALYKWVGVLLSAVLVAALAFYVVTQTSRDIIKFKELDEKRISFEKEIDTIQANPNIHNPDTLLKYYRVTVIPNWKKCTGILDEMDKLDVPKEIKSFSVKLRQYYKLNIENDELKCKAIDENTDVYNEKIKDNKIKIDLIVKSIEN